MTFFYLLFFTKRCLTATEQLEGALLRDVAGLAQTRQSLLTRRVLAARYDATLARLHEVGLTEAAAGMARRAVVHLRLSTHGLCRRAHGTRSLPCRLPCLLRA